MRLAALRLQSCSSMVVGGTISRLAFVHLCTLGRCSMSSSFIGHSSVGHIALAKSFSDLYCHRVPFVEACCAAPVVLFQHACWGNHEWLCVCTLCALGRWSISSASVGHSCGGHVAVAKSFPDSCCNRVCDLLDRLVLQPSVLELVI